MNVTLSKVLSFAAAAALVGCTGEVPNETSNRAPLRRGATPLTHPDFEPDAVRPAATNLLTYYGGPVIAGVKIVQVDWNSSVNSTIKSNMGGFYNAVSSSELFDWLGEYDTNINATAGSHSGQMGTNQHIGHGVFVGDVTLSQGSGTFSDAQVQSAISTNIANGKLPAPDADTIYMINFPSNVTITDSGSTSCVQFCAYHGTFINNNVHVKYAVLPDVSTGGCASGCGSNSNFFNNATSVASHELIEAVTDADVGLIPATSSSYDYPAAWGNNSQGEIGDICNASQGTLAATQPDGTHYVVQKEYDNASGNCIVSKAAATNDFSLSLSSSAVSLAPGASATVTVKTAVVSGSAQSIALTVSGLPAGVTGAFNPASVTAGGSATLTLTAAASAAATTATFTVTGKATSATHTASATVTVTGTTSGGGITNGGFETGSLSGWGATGATVTTTTPHGGKDAAFVGSSNPTNGDSSITQTFTAPTGTSQLSFWYNVNCPDTVQYDWATATLKDNTANTTKTVLAKTCNTKKTWVNVTSAVTAGHSYTLTLISHDDNYAGDATYTLYDDVTLQ